MRKEYTDIVEMFNDISKVIDFKTHFIKAEAKFDLDHWYYDLYIKKISEETPSYPETTNTCFKITFENGFKSLQKLIQQSKTDNNNDENQIRKIKINVRNIKINAIEQFLSRDFTNGNTAYEFSNLKFINNILGDWAYEYCLDNPKEENETKPILKENVKLPEKISEEKWNVINNMLLNDLCFFFNTEQDLINRYHASIKKTSEAFNISEEEVKNLCDRISMLDFNGVELIIFLSGFIGKFSNDDLYRFLISIINEENKYREYFHNTSVVLHDKILIKGRLKQQQIVIQSSVEKKPIEEKEENLSTLSLIGAGVGALALAGLFSTAFSSPSSTSANKKRVKIASKKIETDSVEIIAEENKIKSNNNDK